MYKIKATKLFFVLSVFCVLKNGNGVRVPIRPNEESLRVLVNDPTLGSQEIKLFRDLNPSLIVKKQDELVEDSIKKIEEKSGVNDVEKEKIMKAYLERLREIGEDGYSGIRDRNLGFYQNREENENSKNVKNDKDEAVQRRNEENNKEINENKEIEENEEIEDENDDDNEEDEEENEDNNKEESQKISKSEKYYDKFLTIPFKTDKNTKNRQDHQKKSKNKNELENDNSNFNGNVENLFKRKYHKETQKDPEDFQEPKIQKKFKVPKISDNPEVNDDYKDPISYHENPDPIPTKVNYPGQGQWARKGRKHKPHVTVHKHLYPDEINRENDNVNKRGEFEIYDRNMNSYDKERNGYFNDLKRYSEGYNTDETNHEKEPEEPEEIDEIREDFVPTRTYSQVRRSDVERRISKPKKSSKSKRRNSQKKNKNKRLKEIQKNSKAHTVYTEEGYEDSAYDHGRSEKKGDLVEKDKRIHEENHGVKKNENGNVEIPETPEPPGNDDDDDDNGDENEREEILKIRNYEPGRKKGSEENEEKEGSETRINERRIRTGEKPRRKNQSKNENDKNQEHQNRYHNKKDLKSEDETVIKRNGNDPVIISEGEPSKYFTYENEDWFQKYRFDNINDYFTLPPEPETTTTKIVIEEKIDSKINKEEENIEGKNLKNHEGVLTRPGFIKNLKQNVKVVKVNNPIEIVQEKSLEIEKSPSSHQKLPSINQKLPLITQKLSSLTQNLPSITQKLPQIAQNQPIIQNTYKIIEEIPKKNEENNQFKKNNQVSSLNYQNNRKIGEERLRKIQEKRRKTLYSQQSSTSSPTLPPSNIKKRKAVIQSNENVEEIPQTNQYVNEDQLKKTLEKYYMDSFQLKGVNFPTQTVQPVLFQYYQQIPINAPRYEEIGRNYPREIPTIPILEEIKVKPQLENVRRNFLPLNVENIEIQPRSQYGVEIEGRNGEENEENRKKIKGEEGISSKNEESKVFLQKPHENEENERKRVEEGNFKEETIERTRISENISSKNEERDGFLEKPYGNEENEGKRIEERNFKQKNIDKNENGEEISSKNKEISLKNEERTGFLQKPYRNYENERKRVEEGNFKEENIEQTKNGEETSSKNEEKHGFQQKPYRNEGNERKLVNVGNFRQENVGNIQNGKEISSKNEERHGFLHKPYPNEENEETGRKPIKDESYKQENVEKAKNSKEISSKNEDKLINLRNVENINENLGKNDNKKENFEIIKRIIPKIDENLERNEDKQVKFLHFLQNDENRKGDDDLKEEITRNEPENVFKTSKNDLKTIENLQNQPNERIKQNVEENLKENLQEIPKKSQIFYPLLIAKSDLKNFKQKPQPFPNFYQFYGPKIKNYEEQKQQNENFQEKKKSLEENEETLNKKSNNKSNDEEYEEFVPILLDNIQFYYPPSEENNEEIKNRKSFEEIKENPKEEQRDFQVHQNTERTLVTTSTFKENVGEENEDETAPKLEENVRKEDNFKNANKPEESASILNYQRQNYQNVETNYPANVKNLKKIEETSLKSKLDEKFVNNVKPQTFFPIIIDEPDQNKQNLPIKDNKNEENSKINISRESFDKKSENKQEESLKTFPSQEKEVINVKEIRYPFIIEELYPKSRINEETNPKTLSERGNRKFQFPKGGLVKENYEKQDSVENYPKLYLEDREKWKKIFENDRKFTGNRNFYLNNQENSQNDQENHQNNQDNNQNNQDNNQNNHENHQNIQESNKKIIKNLQNEQETIKKHEEVLQPTIIVHPKPVYNIEDKRIFQPNLKINVEKDENNNHNERYREKTKKVEDELIYPAKVELIEETKPKAINLDDYRVSEDRKSRKEEEKIVENHRKPFEIRVVYPAKEETEQIDRYRARIEELPRPRPFQKKVEEKQERKVIENNSNGRQNKNLNEESEREETFRNKENLRKNSYSDENENKRNYEDGRRSNEEIRRNYKENIRNKAENRRNNDENGRNNDENRRNYEENRRNYDENTRNKENIRTKEENRRNTEENRRNKEENKRSYVENRRNEEENQNKDRNPQNENDSRRIHNKYEERSDKKIKDDDSEETSREEDFKEENNTKERVSSELSSIESLLDTSKESSRESSKESEENSREETSREKLQEDSSENHRNHRNHKKSKRRDSREVSSEESEEKPSKKQRILKSNKNKKHFRKEINTKRPKSGIYKSKITYSSKNEDNNNRNSQTNILYPLRLPEAQPLTKRKSKNVQGVQREEETENEDEIIDIVMGEEKFGKKLIRRRRSLSKNRNKNENGEENKDKNEDTKIKYPNYNSKNFDKSSGFRYAENPEKILTKTKNQMVLYDRVEEIECPTTEDINPVPEKVNNPRNHTEEKNKTDYDPKTRLKGKLSNQIDCLKAKYFGENPLDNPLFNEEYDGKISLSSNAEVSDISDISKFSDRIGKSNEENLPKPEPYVMRRKIIRRRPPPNPVIRDIIERRYPQRYREEKPVFYNQNQRNPYEKEEEEKNNNYFSEVHYKQEIKPSEQLNVFADIINNIKTSNEDKKDVETSESNNEEIYVGRKPVRYQNKNQNYHKDLHQNDYQTRYYPRITTSKPFLPTPLPTEKRRKLPMRILEQHQDADEIIIVKKPPPIRHPPKIKHENSIPSKNFEEKEEEEIISSSDMERFLYDGLRPPPKKPYKHPNFYKLDPERRKSSIKRRRVKRNRESASYSEIRRNTNEKEEEIDDYVPRRNRNFHYDEKTGKIVYDKQPETSNGEEIEEKNEEIEYDYGEIQEKATHPPQKIKKEMKRFPPTPPPGPSYLDYVKILKNNPNYTIYEDPKPKEERGKKGNEKNDEENEDITENAVTSSESTNENPSTGLPEYLSILKKLKEDKSYKVYLDPSPKTKNTGRTDRKKEENNDQQVKSSKRDEEIEEIDEEINGDEIQNSPGVQGIIGLDSPLPVFDISEFVPKIKDYSPKTSIDTSKYTNIRRDPSRNKKNEENDEETKRNNEEIIKILKFEENNEEIKRKNEEIKGNDEEIKRKNEDINISNEEIVENRNGSKTNNEEIKRIKKVEENPEEIEEKLLTTTPQSQTIEIPTTSSKPTTPIVTQTVEVRRRLGGQRRKGFQDVSSTTLNPTATNTQKRQRGRGRYRSTTETNRKVRQNHRNDQDEEGSLKNEESSLKNEESSLKNKDSSLKNEENLDRKLNENIRNRRKIQTTRRIEENHRRNYEDKVKNEEEKGKFDENIRNRRNLHRRNYEIPRNHRRDYSKSRNDIEVFKPTPRSITLNVINQTDFLKLNKKIDPSEEGKEEIINPENVEIFKDADNNKKHGGNYKYKKVQIKITRNYKPGEENNGKTEDFPGKNEEFGGNNEDNRDDNDETDKYFKDVKKTNKFIPKDFFDDPKLAERINTLKERNNFEITETFFQEETVPEDDEDEEEGGRGDDRYETTTQKNLRRISTTTRGTIRGTIRTTTTATTTTRKRLPKIIKDPSKRLYFYAPI